MIMGMKTPIVKLMSFLYFYGGFRRRSTGRNLCVLTPAARAGNSVAVFIVAFNRARVIITCIIVDFIIIRVVVHIIVGVIIHIIIRGG